MTQLEDLVARVETWKALDRVAEPLARAVGRAVRPTPVRNVLSGTVIGHPLHPLLTDVPIGAWTMAAVLDLAGKARAAGPPARCQSVRLSWRRICPDTPARS